MTTGTRPSVIVGYDSTPSSERALQVAALHAIARGARLRVVHAFQYPVFANPLFERLGRGLNRRTVHMRLLALDGVRSAAAGVKAAHPELDVSPALVDGPPGFVLTLQSHRNDLIVLGSRDADRVPRWLDSSVAETVARRGGCPVLTLRTVDPAYPPAGAPIAILCTGRDPASMAAVRAGLCEAATRKVPARLFRVRLRHRPPDTDIGRWLEDLCRQRSDVDCHIGSGTHPARDIPALVGGAGLVVLAQPSGLMHLGHGEVRRAGRRLPAHLLLVGGHAVVSSNGSVMAGPT